MKIYDENTDDDEYVRPQKSKIDLFEEEEELISNLFSSNTLNNTRVKDSISVSDVSDGVNMLKDKLDSDLKQDSNESSKNAKLSSNKDISVLLSISSDHKSKTTLDSDSFTDKTSITSRRKDKDSDSFTDKTSITSRRKDKDSDSFTDKTSITSRRKDKDSDSFTDKTSITSRRKDKDSDSFTDKTSITSRRKDKDSDSFTDKTSITSRRKDKDSDSFTDKTSITSRRKDKDSDSFTDKTSITSRRKDKDSDSFTDKTSITSRRKDKDSDSFADKTSITSRRKDKDSDSFADKTSITSRRKDKDSDSFADKTSITSRRKDKDSDSFADKTSITSRRKDKDSDSFADKTSITSRRKDKDSDSFTDKTSITSRRKDKDSDSFTDKTSITSRRKDKDSDSFTDKTSITSRRKDKDSDLFADKTSITSRRKDKDSDLFTVTTNLSDHESKDNISTRSTLNIDSDSHKKSMTDLKSDDSFGFSDSSITCDINSHFESNKYIKKQQNFIKAKIAKFDDINMLRTFIENNYVDNQLIDNKYKMDISKFNVYNKDFYSDQYHKIMRIVHDWDEQYIADMYCNISDTQLEEKIRLIFSKINFPSILKFIGVSTYLFDSIPYCLFISEDALTTLKQTSHLNETKKLIIIFGIAAGMKYLHSYDILYHYFDPRNILLDESDHPKINHFLVMNDSFNEDTKYLAPEVINGSNHTKSSDVYSFASLVFQILTNQEPISQDNKHSPIPPSVPKCYQDLIESCWSENPEERPTFNDIVNNLKTNLDFIKEGINKEEFLDYILDIIFSIPKFQISDYKQLRKIGKGCFGEVFKTKNKSTSETFAAKVLSNEYGDDLNNENFFNELEIMSKLNHPTIVKLQGFSPINFRNVLHPVIFSEYFKNGNLRDMLDKENKSLVDRKWDDTKKLIIIYGIASGMKYLHSLNILHRDLKPDNILLDEKCFPKICDFGLSKIIDNNETYKEEIIGTPPYLAPEIWKDYKYTKAGDVYAFAMTVYEIITLNDAAFKKRQFDLMKAVIEGERPIISSDTPEFYVKLIESCWKQDFTERPSFSDIVHYIKTNINKYQYKTIDIGEFIMYADEIEPYTSHSNYSDTSHESDFNKFDIFGSSDVDSKLTGLLDYSDIKDSKSSDLSKTGIDAAADSGDLKDSKSSDLSKTGIDAVTDSGDLKDSKSTSLSKTGIDAVADSGDLKDSKSTSLSKTGIDAVADSGDLKDSKSSDLSKTGIDAAADSGDLKDSKSTSLSKTGIDAVADSGDLKDSKSSDLSKTGIDAVTDSGDLKDSKSTSLSKTGIDDNSNSSDEEYGFFEEEENPELIQSFIDSILPTVNLIDLNDYDELGELGSGASGDVYEVLNKATNEKFAAKIIKNNLLDLNTENKDNEGKKQLLNLIREINISAKIDYPSCVKFHGYSIKKVMHPVLLSELVQNNTLRNMLELEKRGIVNNDWTETKKFITIYGIASGMKYLHEHSILHRDLKPENILLNEFLFPKITDFGLSKEIIQVDDTINNIYCIGTSFYMAPEIWSHSYYSKATDVYAFSIILYEIVTNLRPFDGMGYHMIMKNVGIFNERPVFKYNIDQCYKNLIESCWSKDPQERPSFDEIINILLSNEEFTVNVNMDEFNDYRELILNEQILIDDTKITTRPEPTFKETIIQNATEKIDEEAINTFTRVKEEQLSTSLINEYFLDLENYEPKKLLFRTEFSNFYEIVDKNTKKVYSAIISNINMNQFTEDEMTLISIEMNKISQLNYPTILKFIGFSPKNFQNQSKPVVITEPSSRRTLNDIFKKTRKGAVVEGWNATTKLIVIYGIAAGMNYLHSNDILNRNLTPNNIILDKSLHPKITNFGLCTHFLIVNSITAQSSCAIHPSQLYSAPEKFISEEETKKSDVYTFSLIVYEVVTAERPFSKYKNFSQFYNQVVLGGMRPEIKNEVPECYRGLIEKCWCQDQNERPTFENIIEALGSVPDFITSDVNKEEYLNYIRQISK
ncbi:hypothetical protein M9Y10_031688 [Tritrichomonas musculus]|uniref:Protein kinase domain-containing protein n=1 Tax=Tritrichomonas musculus TaxID=1915356 RepID=A0ABR2H237_9EUKA